eukprot:m.307437 g.307437  ORF g.307437 m.307437 type:complete len:263 (+) comp42288_c0_seq1:123-911(+)
MAEEEDSYLKIGIYGWRKRCLYFFILLLLVIIVVNLALTVWILVVTRFNVDGMGQLRITKDGIVMDESSKAKFLGPLYTSSIKTMGGKPLFLESAKEVALKTGSSSLDLTEDSLTASTKSFKVSLDEKTLLSVDENGTTIDSPLSATGSISTTEFTSRKVQSTPGADLHVESRGGSLFLQAPQVSLQSSVSEVRVQAVEEIEFTADTVLLNSTVRFGNVAVFEPGNVTSPDMREVCICEKNSMLYLGSVGGVACSAESLICQ